MKELLKKIIQVIKPYTKLQVVGLFLTILYSATYFAAPIVSRYLIDEVLPSNSINKVYYGLAIFFVVCISQPITGYFKNLLFMKISESITFHLRRDMFTRIMYAPLKFFNKAKKGAIVSRIIDDSRNASNFITNLFIVIIKNIILVIIILGGMFYLSITITSIVLVISTLFLIFNFYLSKKFRKISLEVRKNYDDSCTMIEQATNSIITAKVYQLEEYFIGKYSQILDKAYKDNIKFRYLEIFLNSSAEALTVISITIIYGLGTVYVIQDRMTLGTVVALGLYFQMLIYPVLELLNSNIGIQKIIPIFDRIYEYLELENEEVNKDEIENKIIQNKKNILKGDIIIKDLWFKYENNYILKNINLSIKENSIVAFVGPSGVGKSTLVKLLLGLYSPSSGNIYIGGVNIKSLGLRVLRSNVAYVSQDIDLLNATIIENIRCGNKTIKHTEIIKVCQDVGIHEDIIKLPKGYNTMIYEMPNLSGGQKQKIAIARAIVRKPLIMVFDEPTSALDPESEKKICDLIKRLSKQCTIIIISHRLSTIMSADKIFVFKDGSILEEGKHEMLVKSNGVYAGYIKKANVM
ncbi:ABC transporter ATP-binding protein [Caloranaerobacter ferrireducens]|uniref:ABC transporter ATP-binding protein n=1 Tax=Caloranaerobacter ferrireducens TaxID=1323370 RepID=UPI00084D460B|nr:ABC transporter ATP-binding protein [Caloranaerobacter ferrireducens]